MELAKVGQNEQRSKGNRDTIEEVQDRLDRVERWARSNGMFLALLASEALGIPTDQVFSLLMSIF